MSEPPASLKETIEKTAKYVLKNGISFEAKLLENDKDGKFSFLQESDQFHAYYKQQLEPTTVATPNGTEKPQNHDPKTSKPRDFVFLTQFPPVSNYDNEMIKTAALYIACNSENHIDALRRHMERKGKRRQFAFLNKNHTLHLLFQQYVKQYSVIVETATSADGKEKLSQSLHANKEELFQSSYARAVYEKKHKVETKAKEEQAKQTQLHFASIDWQDFALVAKVNFSAIDEVSELSLPTSRDEIMYRSLETRSKEIELAQETKAPAQDEDTPQTEDNGVKESLPDAKEEATADSVAKHKVPKGMKIRAAGESRLKKKKTTERTIQCPITGKKIAELQFDNHLRVLLRDPSYKEQQDNFMKKNFTYSSNLTTDQVYENIKRLVKKRERSEEEEEHAQAKRVTMGPQV